MKKTINERFWSKVNKTDTCWLWIASTRKDGYGQFRFNGKSGFPAHRASWIIHNGEIPEGLFCLHKCDVRHCCRPDHLFLGTAKDNAIDCIKKGRNNNPKGDSHYFRRCPEKVPRGEKQWQAKLKDDDIFKIKHLFNNGISKLNIAKIYSVHFGTIAHVLSGKTWKHVTKNKVIGIKNG